MQLYKIQNCSVQNIRGFFLLRSISPGKPCSLAEVPFACPQWKAYIMLYSRCAYFSQRASMLAVKWGCDIAIGFVSHFHSKQEYLISYAETGRWVIVSGMSADSGLCMMLQKDRNYNDRCQC